MKCLEFGVKVLGIWGELLAFYIRSIIVYFALIIKGKQNEKKRNTNGKLNRTHLEHKWFTKIKRYGTQTEHKRNTNGTQTEHNEKHKNKLCDKI